VSDHKLLYSPQRGDTCKPGVKRSGTPGERSEEAFFAATRRHKKFCVAALRRRGACWLFTRGSASLHPWLACVAALRRRNRRSHVNLCYILTLILFLTSAIAGCQQRIDPGTIEQFEKAQVEFDKAKTKQDFLRVASMYDQIVRTGVHSGAVFYNQGNAYMRAGERGRAIACYRQAQRYWPRDPLVDANLRSALQGQAKTSFSHRPLIEYILFWQDWFGYAAKFQASVTASFVALVFGIVGMIYVSPIWKRLALATLVLSVAITLSATYDWYRFEYLRHGVVVASEAIARKGNAASYEPAFTAPLAEGTEFIVLEARNDWLRIKIPSAQVGWVRAVDVAVY
jgi:tetratricopeptide (TPR) repeat protein